MGIEKHIEQQLMAFVPKYIEMLGNSTIIYTYSGGKLKIDKSIRTYLKSLAKYFMVDLKESKKYYGKLLGMSNMLPIPFDQNNIFIPVKTRVPMCKNDGAFGYINIDYIEKVEETKGQVIIHLKSDWKIKSVSTMKTIDKHIAYGNIVKRLYKERQTSLPKVIDFYYEYEQPATKGDIALLREEIIKIKETLN